MRRIASSIARAKRAMGQLGHRRMFCFLEPGAKRGSVRGLYRDLKWTFRARRSPFKRAEIAFIQKDHYDTWQACRKKQNPGAALSQLPHVSGLLVAKAPLAELIRGRPYTPETHADSCGGQLQGIWVQKPSRGGRGSEITFLRDPGDWEKPGYILQRYLDTPYLIDGRKFDIRVLVNIDDQGAFRIHPDGLIRCANRPFDHTSLDPQIHNSNTCFQHREKIDQGPQLLLSNSPLADSAPPQIETILKDVLRLLRKRDVFRGTRDFEILGIDFLVDETEKLWLLEINQHPGWHSSCPENGHFYLDALESLFDRS